MTFPIQVLRGVVDWLANRVSRVSKDDVGLKVSLLCLRPLEILESQDLLGDLVLKGRLDCLVSTVTRAIVVLVM